MRTLTNGTLTVLAYDERVWLQERNLLRIKDENATIVTIGLNISEPIATYTLDENHEAVVDMSDYIRTYRGERSIFVRSDSGSATYVNANYVVAGLINPKNVMIPETDNGFPITFPTSYQQAFAGTQFRIAAEMCASEEAVVWCRRGAAEAMFQLEPWIPQVIGKMENMQTVDTITQDTRKTYQVKELAPCRRYAAVRWVSFTGQTRVHTWEVTKAKTATDGAIELLTIDGSYNTLKGREDGFVLRLDGLNAYDMWYYTDIITSSQVEVSMDGATWQRVDITTKDVTIPDGDAGKLNTLEINCNWRKYDAITL